MAKPAIVSVDDDAAVSAAIGRDLREPLRVRLPDRAHDLWRASARTAGDAGAAGTAGCVDRFGSEDAADDRRAVPRTGQGALARAPSWCLLTAYADTDAAIKAINDIGLDYYLMKPWNPPEERLFPVLDELLEDWRHANPDRSQRGPRRRPSVVRTLPRTPRLPGPQSRAVRVARHRTRRGSTAPAGPAPAPPRRICRSSSCPTWTCCAHRRRSRSRRRSACAPARRTWSTTSASSVPAPPASPPRCTEHPKASARSSSSARRRAGKRARVRRIENYLGFPKGLSGADLAHRAVAQVDALRRRDGARARRHAPRRAGPRQERCRLGDDAEIESRGSRRGHGCLLPATRCAGHRLRRGSRHLLRGQRGRGTGRARAKTSTWSAAPTPRDKPCSTWPATRAGWSCWCAATISSCRCPAI